MTRRTRNLGGPFSWSKRIDSLWPVRQSRVPGVHWITVSAANLRRMRRIESRVGPTVTIHGHE